MRLSKANIAGLTSPRQQSEMKSILAGTWPPLKPLPIFKYETVEYRATIDFDKKRGEWVCRKTSLPSNKVQELRGGLREITMALPHGEGEVFTGDEEQLEQELEKDTNRRLQAIHEWIENFGNGGLYFELRNYLSQSQQTEIDDSLRLSLTARQLQFNSKNVAYVFDALSTAGGRFAALIEFAKRNKAKRETAPQAQGEGAMPETEWAIVHVNQPLEVSSLEFGHVLNDNPLVPDQEAAEPCTDADELPAVSIKDVFPEPDQASLPERTVHPASQQFEIETSEMLDADSASLVEYPHQEGHHSPAFTGVAAQVRTGPSSANRIEGLSSRFPAIQISPFQVAVCALLFIFAVIAFTVGLTVGRGSVGRHVRGAAKSTVATDAKSTTPPDRKDESTSRTATPPVAGSDASAGTHRLDRTRPTGERSDESTRGSEYFAEGRSTNSNSDSSPTTESKPSAKPEVNSEHSDGLIVRNVSPGASYEPNAHKAVGATSSAPGSPAPYGLTPTIGAELHPPRPSAILVTIPDRGSQPFTFPEKAIAATSSFAMTSQLSVFVSPEPGPTVAHRPARLEGGELVYFVWPRYPRPGRRHGLAETIRVRANIGQLGQVLEVKFLSGSLSLLSATTRAIRQWRYRPTRLDSRPVPAQQDITIEYRPPQYSSQVSTHRPSHN
jgi:Gram-negative bacterial TonB protein C-terminal